MKLYRKAKGKEEVILEGTLPVLRQKMKSLRASQRGGCSGRGGVKFKVEYRIED